MARLVATLQQRAGLISCSSCFCRRLSLAHHPDRNYGDDSSTERFARISAAMDKVRTHREKAKSRQSASQGPDNYEFTFRMPTPRRHRQDSVDGDEEVSETEYQGDSDDDEVWEEFAEYGDIFADAMSEFYMFM